MVLVGGAYFGHRCSLAQAVSKDALTAEAVRRAIKHGVDNLKKSQNANGSWLGHSGYEGGTTALVTLALLNAGESPESPQIQKSLKLILAIPRSTTYEVSLRVLALSAADPTSTRYRSTIQGDIEWLLKGQAAGGGWSYKAGRGGSDASNSQFALLALSEANKYDIVIPKRHWRKAKRYWFSLYSKKDGGFSYQPSSSSTGSMTCAGIASLVIVRENLFDLANLANGNQAICCGGADPTGKKTQSRQRFYYLYALERAGRFSGRRFLGPHDWYRVGAADLVRTQRAGGAWAVGRRGRASFGEDKEAITTAFSLLFLSIEKDWNAIEKGKGTKLNWQTVRAKDATTNDLFESPVLFMSGRDAIGLDAQQKKTLKEYIENGGFLFAEACQGDGCGSNAPFDAAFRELCTVSNWT